METTRRQFCGLGLIAPVSGFGGRRPKNTRRKHKDERLYHGPIRLPDAVLVKARQTDVYKTTHRHLAVRIHHDGIVWLMRVVCGKDYVGEVVRTQSGGIRVHVWAATTHAGRDVSEVLDDQ